MSVVRRVEDLLEKEAYTEARPVIRRALRADPEDHWLWSCLATTYYEKGNYRRSLEYEAKAVELAPRCPAALTGYADRLYLLGRVGEAMAVYRRILNRGVESLARGPCGEGRRSALALMNHCRYRIALCYRDGGEYRPAIQWLKKHLAHRARGIPCVFPIREVRSQLSTWQLLWETERELGRIEQALDDAERELSE